MGLSRLTTAHITIIGVVLALLIGVTFFILGPYKTSQNVTLLAERESTAETKLRDEEKNKRDLNLAEQEVAQVRAQFARYEARLMPKPPIDLKDPSEAAMTKAMIELWKQPYLICAAANRFAREQATRNKVQLLSPPFAIAGQPTDPAAIPTTIIELPMGTIQVAGSFKNVNDYMRAWNRFKRLVAIDGMQLSTGPNPAGNQPVVAQANVTVYIFPRANPGQAGPAATDSYGYGGYGGTGSPYGTGYGGPPGGPGYGPPPGGPPGIGSGGPATGGA